MEQTQAIEIFQSIRILLKRFEPPFVATIDIEGRYELWTKKELVYEGKKRKEFFFAGLIIQKKYVGFYYMPLYTDEVSIKPQIQPELLKLLKGKTCFHVKRLDKTVLEQIEQALQVGYELYQEKTWV